MLFQSFTGGEPITQCWQHGLHRPVLGTPDPMMCPVRGIAENRDRFLFARRGPEPIPLPGKAPICSQGGKQAPDCRIAKTARSKSGMHHTVTEPPLARKFKHLKGLKRRYTFRIGEEKKGQGRSKFRPSGAFTVEPVQILS